MNQKLAHEFAVAISEGNGLRWRAAEIAYEYGVGDHTQDVARELASAGHVSVSTVENLARAQRAFEVLKEAIMREEDEDKMNRLLECKKRLSYVYFHHVGLWIKAKSPTLEDVLSALEGAREQTAWASTIRDHLIPDDIPTWKYKIPKVVKTLEIFSDVYDLPKEYREQTKQFLEKMRGWNETLD